MNNMHRSNATVAFRWSRWRNKKRQEVPFCLMVLVGGLVVLGAGGVAQAGPTGGQITSGTGSIGNAGPTTTVDQSSHLLDVNWQTFSTTATESVNFNQPDATAIAINRVVGGIPSELAGALNANGRVFILNSAGITFTGTSHVNVGALLATTAMTTSGTVNDASFSGTGYGAVVNHGSIQVSQGGFAILAAPYVQNTGFIKADLGTVALAGTNSFTLDLRGDGLINFVVPPGTIQEIAADGKRIGVDNSGSVRARSGQVVITANVATQVVNAVVNMNGIVDADAFAPTGNGGSVLVASEGLTNVSGTITAQGGSTAGNGGQIETSGRSLEIAGAVVDTSAPNGHTGTWLLDPFDLTVVGSGGSTILPSGGVYTADAGGSIVTASDIAAALATTNVTLQTSGAAGDGNGNGDINVNAAIAWSSANGLTLNAFRDINVNASITHAGANSAGLNMNPNQGSAGGKLNVASGNAVTLRSSDLLTIAGNPYTIVTNIAGLNAIADNLSGNYALGNGINLASVGNFAPIGGAAAFSGDFQGLGHAIGNLSINSSAQNVGLFSQIAGGSVENLALNNVNVTSAYGGAVAGSPASFGSLGALVGRFDSGNVSNVSVTGSVTSGSSWESVGGLVGVNNGTVINTASAVKLVDTGLHSEGGDLVGYNGAMVSNSTATGKVTASGDDSAIGGLVGFNDSGATIEGSSASGGVATTLPTSGVSVLGMGVGGLVGGNAGIVDNSHATGAVTQTGSASYIGGLIGHNRIGGTISNSYAMGKVTLTTGALGATPVNYSAVGGLVGYNESGTTISNSTTGHNGLAGGAVSLSGSASDVGGLIGGNSGSIDSLTAANLVTGIGYGIDVGGLIGGNYGGAISNSTASGRVTMSGDWDSVGGLVGYNNVSGSIGNSSASGIVASTFVIQGGPKTGIGTGGLVGDNWGTVAGSFATGATSETSPTSGVDNSGIGGLVGANHFGAMILSSYATGSVKLTSGTTSATSVWNGVGGLVGLNDLGATIINSTTGNGGIPGGTIVASGTQFDVGGLVGGNYGSVDPESVSNNVTASGVNFDIGGLIGGNYASAILNSAASGRIAATGDNIAVGGLIGFNDPNSAIDGSSASGAVSANGPTSGASVQGIRAGGLVGGNWGVVSNSHATGAVTETGSNSYVGGLIGANRPGAKVSNTYATGAVRLVTGAQGTNPLYSAVGGLVGYNFATASILSSTTGIGGAPGGIVSVVGSDFDVGGLIGGNSGSLDSLTVGSAVAGTGFNFDVGGLIGGNYDGQLTNSSASGKTSASGDNAAIGGLVGFNDRTSSISGSSASGAVGANAPTAGDAVQGMGVGGLVGSNWGAIDNSNAIGAVRENGSASLVGGLVGNNHSGASISDSYAMGLVSLNTGAYGSTTILFSNVGGLVGHNDSGATISTSQTGHAGVAGGPVTVSGASFQEGGLVGNNHGDIMSSTATGAVSGTIKGSITGATVAAWLGGLVGYNQDSTSTVTHSSASGSVTGTVSVLTSGGAIAGIFVGGLMGDNEGTVGNSDSVGVVTARGGPNSDGTGGLIGLNVGSVNSSFSTGIVTTASGSQFIGGLIGQNGGQIANSYSAGAIRAGTNSNAVGGLVGLMTGGTVGTSYSSGQVSAGAGSQSIAGLIGIKLGGTVSSSFWDTTTSHQALGIGGGSTIGVTGEPTSLMQLEATFTDAGWDFINVWTIAPNAYPTLQNVP